MSTEAFTKIQPPITKLEIIEEIENSFDCKIQTPTWVRSKLGEGRNMKIAVYEPQNVISGENNFLPNSICHIINRLGEVEGLLVSTHQRINDHDVVFIPNLANNYQIKFSWRNYSPKDFEKARELSISGYDLWVSSAQPSLQYPHFQMTDSIPVNGRAAERLPIVKAVYDRYFEENKVIVSQTPTGEDIELRCRVYEDANEALVALQKFEENNIHADLLSVGGCLVVLPLKKSTYGSFSPLRTFAFMGSSVKGIQAPIDGETYIPNIWEELNELIVDEELIDTILSTHLPN